MDEHFKQNSRLKFWANFRTKILDKFWTNVLNSSGLKFGTTFLTKILDHILDQSFILNLESLLDQHYGPNLRHKF